MRFFLPVYSSSVQTIVLVCLDGNSGRWEIIMQTSLLYLRFAGFYEEIGV